MIRRMLYAIILLAAAVFVVRVAVVARDFNTVVTSAKFDAVRDNHTGLRAFLQRMPKGGDLHTHFPARFMPNVSLPGRRSRHFCADPANTLLSKSKCGLPADVPAADAMHDQQFYDQLVNAFSTRSFVPTVAVPTDHDKFFDAFGKFAEGFRLALRRHDAGSAQGLPQRERAICRVHGVVLVLG